MRRWQASFFLASLAVVLANVHSGALCQESLADLPSFRQGCIALEDRRFETATALFEKTWQTLKEGEAGEAEKDFVTSRILRSLVENGSHSEALLWLRENPPVSPSSQTSLRAAQVFQAEELFAEAAESYKKLIAKGITLDPRLALNYAICLARSDEPEAALNIIKLLPPPDSIEETIRRAQISAGAGQHKAALNLLDQVVVDEKESPELRLPTLQTRIYSLEHLGRNTEAVEVVSRLIQSAKTSEEALIAFLILEQTVTGKSISGLKGKMQQWSEDHNHPAAPTIALFNLLWFSPPDELVSRLQKLKSETEEKPIVAEIELRLAITNTEETLSSVSIESIYNDADLAARYDFLRTSSFFDEDQFEKAAERFLSAANRLSGQSRSASLHNGAIGLLRAGDWKKFATVQQRLQEIDPISPLNSELEFLQGLNLASRGEPTAYEILSQFVGDNPNHDRFVEAQLAMAEIQLNQAPARPKAARDIFDQLQSRPLTLIQQERLDYLSIWASLMAAESEPRLELTDNFLTNWPNSVYFAEVCMLEASHYYELKRRDLAKERFTQISTQFPNSEYARIARFFAAKSTARSESTIAEWTPIIEEGSELSPYASHELGLLYLSLNRFEDAKAAFEEIISEKNAPESLLYAVQADLGFAWYSEALTNDKHPGQLKKAAELFTTLSSSTQAPALWRYSAAVRRGKCLEALGSEDIALEIYRSIVDETGDSDSLLLPELSIDELDWVFRAGFSAITLLKEREDWAAAIRVADSLAERDGSRSFEATRLARSLRLKHWVWE